MPGGQTRSTSLVSGRITSTNPKGFKLDSQGDEWLNWSKFGAPPANERPSLRNGMQVQIEIDDKGFVYNVTGPNGEALGVSASGTDATGGGKGWQPEDSWRATLLSCMRSAATVVAPMIGGDNLVRVGEQSLKPSDVTYTMAVSLAKRVWLEPMPPLPKPPNGTDVAGQG